MLIVLVTRASLWPLITAAEIAAALAFVGACLGVASVRPPGKSRSFAVAADWLAVFVLIVVAAGAVITAVSGEYAILLAYITAIVACATAGAALDRCRWLLACECVVLGLYSVLMAWIIATSAGSWNRRSYDVTEGTLAIMALTWVTILLLVIFGGMTVGATVRRRIRLAWFSTKR